MVVPLGINYSEFYSDISERLATVGYASSMSLTINGVEWKRGELAEASAREAGLEFRVAGSTKLQKFFYQMPNFYRTVDAVLMRLSVRGQTYRSWRQLRLAGLSSALQ